jgi:hypothetical protein
VQWYRNAWFAWFDLHRSLVAVRRALCFALLVLAAMAALAVVETWQAFVTGSVLMGWSGGLITGCAAIMAGDLVRSYYRD